MTRRAAWEILRGRGEAPTRRVAAEAERRGFDRRDRAFLRRLVATHARRLGALRAVVRRYAHGRPDADLARFLHIGIVQLLFLDHVPDHAAVSETVSAVSDALGRSRARYANAVLRAVASARRPGRSGDPCRDIPLREVHLTEPVFPDPAEHPLSWAEGALSLPAPLARRWVRRMGREQAFALAEGLLEEPSLSLRVTVADRAALAGELERDAGVLTAVGRHPAILLAPADATEAVLGSDPFRAGRFTVQGETALRAVELGEAKAGERWIDLCAAPGGKTAVLAARGARVVACDRDEVRLARVRDTLERLGLATAVELRELKEDSPELEGSFDAALIDVPCSNTGVLAQRPEARWRFEPSSLRALEAIQTMLLARGARAVRPGGRIVYATCSLEPEENRRRVQAFLDERAGWSLEAELEILPAPRDPLGPIDGGYAACIRGPVA